MNDPLSPSECERFRRSIGLAALTLSEDGTTYEMDRDVDDVDDDVALATLAEETAAVAHAEHTAEAEYRAWRASRTNEILEGDPKLAEWKVRSLLEEEPAFMKHKARMASFAAVRVALLGYTEAIRHRAHMLPR